MIPRSLESGSAFRNTVLLEYFYGGRDNADKRILAKYRGKV